MYDCVDVYNVELESVGLLSLKDCADQFCGKNNKFISRLFVSIESAQ